MKIPTSPENFDPLRYRRLYPVEQVRSVKIDSDATVIIEFDCLDDGPQNSIPGFENQPTNAVMGLARENAQKLVDLLRATLAEEVL